MGPRRPGDQSRPEQRKDDHASIIDEELPCEILLAHDLDIEEIAREHGEVTTRRRLRMNGSRADRKEQREKEMRQRTPAEQSSRGHHINSSTESPTEATSPRYGPP